MSPADRQSSECTIHACTVLQALLARYGRSEGVMVGVLVEDCCQAVQHAESGSAGGLVPLRTDLSGGACVSVLTTVFGLLLC